MKYILILLIFMSSCGREVERITGPMGPAGATGATGSPGVAGAQGVAGATGAQGIAGTNGVSCSTQIVSTGVDIICPGSVVVTVHNGIDGLSGRNGRDGEDSDVSVVQFCHGQTTYPSVFGEVGFCINNKLYANFWDGHNSWLTEVPPGSYSSTSTSLPCNFSVGSNCSISH